MCSKCEWAVKDLLKKVVHLCPFWDTFNVMKCTYYLKVTIICRYIFLRFWNSVHFTGIKFCVG